MLRFGLFPTNGHFGHGGCGDGLKLVVPFVVLILSRTCMSFKMRQLLAQQKLNVFKTVDNVADDREMENSIELTHARRSLLQTLEWKYTGWSMAICTTKKDCVTIGHHMICSDNQCGCNIDNVLVDNKWVERGCYPKANFFATCITNEQCSTMNRNTYCNPSNHCTCSPGYYFDGKDCIIRYDSNLKAQEVYKAAVVAAACFIVAVVGIFVVCIVRRSFCRREQNAQQNESTRSSDVFSVSDEIAALRAVDKPPSYEEVLQIERTFYGIPPPEYSLIRSNSHLSNQDTVPQYITDPMNECERACCQQDAASTDNQHCTSQDSVSSILIPLKDTNLHAVGATESIICTTNLLPTEINQDELNLYASNSQSPAELQDSLSSFIATAEVLSQPSFPHIPPVLLVPAISKAPSSHYFSSTPPPRLSRLHHVLPPLSASLPSSPHNVPHWPHTSAFMLQEKLLEQKALDPATVAPPLPLNQTSMPCISNAHQSPLTGTSNSAFAKEVDDNSTSNDTLIHRPDQDTFIIAYDNPGFVGDMQNFDNALD